MNTTDTLSAAPTPQAPIVDLWLQAVFLVGSNIAFLLPVPGAWRKGLHYEGAIYIGICVISSVAHYTGVYKCCLFMINEKCYMDHSLLGKFDVTNAYQIVSTTFLMFVYPLPGSPKSAGTTRLHEGSKVLINAYLCILVALFMADDFEEPIIRTIIGAVVTLFSIGFAAVAYFVMKVDCNMDGHSFALGWLFFLFAIASFGMGGMYKDFNWFIHAFWHIFMGFALWFFIDGKGKVKVRAHSESNNQRYLAYYAVPVAAIVRA